MSDMPIDEITDQVKSALYDKSCVCPLCNSNFTAKAVKVGKNQVTSLDDDLYPHYSLVNPILYDVIVCPECGYSTISKNTKNLLSQQKKWLNEIFFKGNTNKPTYGEYTTTEEAIHKHKMALLACITRKGKLNEQAYIALHIAWLLRDLGKEKESKSFLSRAYDAYREAFSKESFPMVGTDEQTLMYTLAAIAYELEKYSESKQYLSMVITRPEISARLKDRAFTLKEKLAEVL